MLSSLLGKVPLVAALCLSTLPRTLGLRTASACQGRRMKQPTFCVNATIENDVMTYQLTNLVEPEDQIGWMAIGHGTTMLNSDMYILWKNDDGSTTVSQRRAVWYSEPLVLKRPKRLADPVEPKLTAWHPEKSTTYAFQIPVNKTQLAISSKEDLIFAYSPVRPSDESPHASMARHKEAGYITLEFSEEQKDAHMPQADSPSKTPSSHKGDDKDTDNHSKSGKHTTTVLLHAFFLSFGFLLLLPTGVITARWARTFTPVWFKVHWIINFPLALPCILLGWIAGPIAVNQHGSGHFNDQHKIWGTIIVSVYLVQVLLGRHIHQKKLEQIPLTRVHPPMNIGHAVLGCLLLVFAFLQVRSGLEKLSYAPGFEDSANWGIKLWNFWVVAVPFVYIVGLYLIPKQFAQEREMLKNQNAEGYAALPDNEGARLLAAAEERDMEERMNSKPR